MPVTVSVKADYERVRAAFKRYPREVKLANTRALNRAMTHGKTVAYRHIREQRTLPVAEIKSKVKTRRATFSHQVASIVYDNHAISLTHYKHKFSRRNGLTVTIFAHGSPKLVRQYGNKGFINAASRLGSGAFVRTSAKRAPIVKLHGPGVGSAVTAHGYDAAVTAEMSDMWQKRILHNIEQILGSRTA